MVNRMHDPIRSDMVVLDVISRHRETEAVFRRYDQKAGVCLCCEALFETIRGMAEKYRLDLDALLADLKAAAASEDSERNQ
ncbi:conserved hypothetical protein [uncultured Desulfatiglans sp.]|uniref:DUF1858 domain-containing protein n=1 Tax=Uncultured Desulfatiglans sp. TaxID=1748965 RepID=A0A653A2V6_UNCDX|nr:conserved hypothetical protein [uncultured Desulfatiglans sp.]